LDPHESVPNGISIGLAVFAQLTGMPSTHRRTDDPVCKAIGGNYALHAGDAAKKWEVHKKT